MKRAFVPVAARKHVVKGCEPRGSRDFCLLALGLNFMHRNDSSSGLEIAEVA